MLYLPPGTGLPIRIHGTFISDEEVHRVVNDWKNRAEPEYLNEILEDNPENGNEFATENNNSGEYISPRRRQHKWFIGWSSFVFQWFSVG